MKTTMHTDCDWFQHCEASMLAQACFTTRTTAALPLAVLVAQIRFKAVLDLPGNMLYAVIA